MKERSIFQTVDFKMMQVFSDEYPCQKSSIARLTPSARSWRICRVDSTTLAHDNGLGKFQFQPFAGQTRFGQDAPGYFREIGLGELKGRNVHGKANGCIAALIPSTPCRQTSRSTHSPIGNDQPALFGLWDKAARGNLASTGCLNEGALQRDRSPAAAN